MLTVYRIENERDEGPFQSYGDDWKDVYNVLNEHDSYAHPSPRNDGIDNMERSEVCGCISMEQIEVWFPEPCRTKLAAHGFSLKTFVVEDAKIGKHQCVFKRS